MSIHNIKSCMHTQYLQMLTIVNSIEIEYYTQALVALLLNAEHWLDERTLKHNTNSLKNLVYSVVMDL